MNKVVFPPYLYIYRDVTFNNLEALRTNHLYFSSANYYDDPFDTFLHIDNESNRRKLSPERKEFINSLIEHYHPEEAADVQEMLKDLLGDTLQGMLGAEMDEKLDYSKYDYRNKETDDSRNSYSRV